MPTVMRRRTQLGSVFNLNNGYMNAPLHRCGNDLHSLVCIHGIGSDFGLGTTPNLMRD